MSSDEPTVPRKERRNPWPDGPDRKLGLFPILTVGLSTKDRDMDCAINSAADEDLSPEERKEVVRSLEALVRHFSEPCAAGRYTVKVINGRFVAVVEG